MNVPLAFDPIAEARRRWEAEWGPSESPTMGAVVSIMRTEQILMGRLNAILEPFGLTFPRYEALMVLVFSRKGELPLGKLSERLQVHRASVTNVIDKLVDDQYVIRRADDNDRRTVLAAITDVGATVARDATTALSHARFATGPLANDQCELIFDTLKMFREAAGDFKI